MKQQPVPSLLPCQFLCLLPSLFPFLRNRKNQTNGFVVRFFEEGTNPDGNKYLLFIKDIYRNGYIGERDVCSLVPIPCSHPPHQGIAPAPSSGNSSCTLIGPRCHVRPVQPTGLAAVFCWIRERLSAVRSAAPPPRMPQTLYPLHQYR